MRAYLPSEGGVFEGDPLAGGAKAPGYGAGPHVHPLHATCPQFDAVACRGLLRSAGDQAERAGRAQRGLDLSLSHNWPNERGR